jgi:hypothetical protein
VAGRRGASQPLALRAGARCAVAVLRRSAVGSAAACGVWLPERPLRWTASSSRDRVLFQVRGGKWKKFVLDEICFLQLQGLQVSTADLALDLRGAAMPYVGKEYVQTCIRSHAGPYSIAEREEIERRRKKLNSGRMLSDEQLLQICDPGPTTEETEKMLAHN